MIWNDGDKIINTLLIFHQAFWSFTSLLLNNYHEDDKHSYDDVSSNCDVYVNRAQQYFGLKNNKDKEMGSRTHHPSSIPA